MKILIIILSIVLVGCSSKRTLDQVEFLNACKTLIEENRVEKKSNGYILSVKQLPLEYLAIKELNKMERQSKLVFDSLLESYGSGVYFTLTIRPDEDKRKGDLIIQGVSDYEEYKERIHALSFRLDRMLSLKIGDKEIKPVLTDMERTFGVKPERIFNITFLPTKEDLNLVLENMEVVFHDQIFETGISHFHLSKIKSKNLPQLIIVAT